MNARFLAIVCATLAIAAPFGAVAQQNDSLGAGWREQQNEARRGVQQGNVSLAQVIETIRRTTPGRQLDAGLETAGGRQVYRVRWAAADGRRIDYLVDAKSGAILSAGGG
jgi:uncharacterized membrane protein YkoI